MKNETKEKTLTFTRKRLLIGAALLLIFAVLGGFGGYKHINIRKANKTLKTQIKASNERIELLENTLETSAEFQTEKQDVQKTWYAEFIKERKLRKQLQNENFIFRNYSRFHIDSFLSKYKYRPQLSVED